MISEQYHQQRSHYMLSHFADWLSVPDGDCTYIMWNDTNLESHVSKILLAIFYRT